MTPEKTLTEANAINWDLIQRLATKAHKHLNIVEVEGARYGLMVDGVFDNCCNGVGEVMQEARTVQHLLDLGGVPEGTGCDDVNIDARVFLLLRKVQELGERLDRIESWHARETGPAGMVGDSCVECETRWPCATRRMAEGTYVDEEDAA